jgi:uncharacterized protein
MSATVQIPSPEAHGLSARYWEGTREGRFVVQRCAGCGTLRHYAQILCSACWSHEHDWVELNGGGLVHSWTVTHHAFHAAFRDALPYALVTVDMDEGVRALGRLDGMDADDLKIGLRLRATFIMAKDGFGRLTFVPDQG